jgi:hypothetical protein
LYRTWHIYVVCTLGEPCDHYVKELWIRIRIHLASWIRIRIRNADPEPEAWKFTKIYKKLGFLPSEMAFGMFFDLLRTYIFYVKI